MRATHHVLAAIGLAASCGGSGDPIVGHWQSVMSIGGSHNDMNVSAHHDGQATIYYAAENQAYHADYNFNIETTAQGAYDFKMDCSGCSAGAFNMLCNFLQGTQDEFTCKGMGSGFDTYDFEWKRADSLPNPAGTTCTGTPDPCGAHIAGSTCMSAAGCSWDGVTCHGLPQPCGDFKSADTCARQSGCGWQ